MANGTAEIMTPDGDADEERGIELAELYANYHTVDGSLRTVDEIAQVHIPEQRQPAHDVVEFAEDNTVELTTSIAPSPVEGGKTLYGTFGNQVGFAGGLAIEGTIRGRDIIRLNRLHASRLGRYVVPRVLPGGR